MARFKDLSGKKFFRLTVVRRVGRVGERVVWLVKCDCGISKTVRASDIHKIRSCGCYNKELRIKRNTKHGMSGCEEYGIWQDMRRRCRNKARPDYALYGGAGITVCKRWDSFENFYLDMGKKPKGMTIDRIDGALGYSKKNCRWADWKTQQRNKKNNHIINYSGQEMCLAAWCDKLNIPYGRVSARIRRGWDVQDAFVVP